MPSVFDSIFADADVVIGNYHGEAVEYTFLDGHSVTDSAAFVDAIESGYEVDAGIRKSQDDRENTQGTTYQSRRTFGLRKSVIGQAEPEIYATLRVVSEGDSANVWTVWRIIGNDADTRWYVECERVEKHEQSRANLRVRG
jgi:hypothetical protein